MIRRGHEPDHSAYRSVPPNYLTASGRTWRVVLDGIRVDLQLLEVVARNILQVGFGQRLACQGQVGALVSADVIANEVSYPACPVLELGSDFRLITGLAEMFQEGIA